MAITDRLGATVSDTPVSPEAYGPSSAIAIKTPVRIATTANITLAGLQTIDGVLAAADDRVLVKNQTDATTNGIYLASTGNWTRATDADSISEFGKGMIVYVLEGTLHGAKGFRLTSDTPLTVGTDDIEFAAMAFPLSVIPFIIDGGGAQITTGNKGYLEVPFDCTVISARLFADRTDGSCVIDIWKGTYASLPTVANSICASAKPTLSAAQKSQDTTLTGWTKSLSTNDILAFNVDSATILARVTVSLMVSRNL